MIRSIHSNDSSNTNQQSVFPANSYCVVLGGGGARGLAHLGAMLAIGEQRTPISRVVGVSMGALMGGLVAVEGSPVRARDRAMEYLESRSGRKLRATVMSTGGLSEEKSRRNFGARLFRELKKQTALSRAVRSHSLLTSNLLREPIDALIPDIDIRDLPTPLQVVTVDLRTGQRVVLESGSLRRAIRASMSIPGIFPPVHHDGKLLRDIGVYDSVPCNIPANKTAVGTDSEGVIAVDVGKLDDECAPCDSALDAILRSQALAEQAIRQHSLASADVVVRPDLSQIEWFDFTNLESIIQSGYQAAKTAIGQVSQASAG